MGLLTGLRQFHQLVFQMGRGLRLRSARMLYKLLAVESSAYAETAEPYQHEPWACEEE